MNVLHVVLTSRFIKLVANFLKLASYPFHWLFPRKRFTIPAHAGPWWKRPDNTEDIPRIIWQTNFTDRVTLPVYLNYLFNRLMAPGFEYRFMVTQARGDFIKTHYPEETFQNYNRLQIGAAQADVWRVLVLLKHGGVYLDIDAHLVWPLAWILRRTKKELYVTTRKGQLSNYFIASQPESSHLQKVADRINLNINERRFSGVFQLTGPGVFNEVLDPAEVNTISYRHACNQGNFTNRHFQYIDKKEGKWHEQQRREKLIRED
ncbi:glycosyl transferase [Halomonas aestuarii]|uniref:Glycosyl transferase n=1 Tax=Halomonas aestuarii TaxID=1897729 RepID=A0A1J0VJB5_9GAMM|nr:glycosyltransferase [Halomonas aestuarii]APE32106.1 glycosyl transferase [Halomonas aestuarii]